MFSFFLWKLNATTGNLSISEKEKGFILEFCVGSDYPYAESFIFRSIHPDGIPKYSFSEKFFKISRSVSLTEYFSKKL